MGRQPPPHTNIRGANGNLDLGDPLAWKGEVPEPVGWDLLLNFRGAQRGGAIVPGSFPGG